jgi:hypothetical protein
MPISRESAEDLAVRILVWLTEDNARIGAFMGWSGETPDGLRARLSDPDLLLAILDFVLMDEAMLIEACQSLEIKPETPLQARAALPGGAAYHWT